MIGYIIFIIIFLVGILYTVKNKDKKNELMVSLYDILCVGLSIILDTIIKKFDRRKPFEGTHRTVVCST